MEARARHGLRGEPLRQAESGVAKSGMSRAYALLSQVVFLNARPASITKALSQQCRFAPRNKLDEGRACQPARRLRNLGKTNH
jgi:hypothetical protein